MANLPPEPSYVFSAEGFYHLDLSSAPIEEPYVFSHGLATGLPLIIRSSHMRINTKRRRKKRQRKPSPVATFQSAFVPLFTFDRHTLLPPTLYSPAVYAPLYTYSYRSPQRKSLIEHYRDVAWKLRCALVGSPLAEFVDATEPTVFERFAEDVATADAVEGRLRAVFRRFFHGARLRRLSARALNVEDPATLSQPRIPIVLYDWESRGVWRYEAASVRDQMSAQLTHVSYGFPSTQSPRNPLTNKEYTYGQLLSVIRQLREAGKTNSLVEGYADVGCKNGVFQAIYWRKIRLRHFERVYADERSEEFRDDFAGFIVELIYTLVRLEFRLEMEDLFRWGVKHAIENAYIQEWKGLYRQNQITEILYKDDPAYERMRRSIKGLAAVLFKQKKGLEGLKALWRLRSLDDSDAVYETESYDDDADSVF